MSHTPKLHLPHLTPNQAQKHVTVNDAIARIDALVHLHLEATGITILRVDAVDGTCFLVHAALDAGLAIAAGLVACRDEGAWRFLVPKAGWIAQDSATRGLLVHNGTDFEAYGSPRGMPLGIGGAPVTVSTSNTEPARVTSTGLVGSARPIRRPSSMF